MKNLFAVLVLMFAFANVAFAENSGLSTELSVTQGAPAILVGENDTSSPYYFGAGLIELKSVAFPVTRDEANYIMNYSGVRTESPRRLAKNLTFGYREENVSLEVSYTFDDPGAVAETQGTYTGYSWVDGSVQHVPMSVKHSEVYSAWQLSALGEHALNDYVSLVGMIGFTSSRVVSETRTQFVCIPACSTYQGSSSEVAQSTITYGVGLKAIVMNRPSGDVWALLMFKKLPNGFFTSEAGLRFPL